MVPSEPQQPLFWFMDYNRKGRNPLIDDVDIGFLLTICVLAVVGLIAAPPIEANLAGHIASFVKGLASVLPTTFTMVVFFCACGGFLLSCWLCLWPRWLSDPKSHQKTPVETHAGIFRAVQGSDWEHYRATATGMRSLVSALAPTNWLFAVGLLFTVLMVICSRYSHGDWEMFGMELEIRDIFRTTREVVGYVIGIAAGITTLAAITGLAEDWWSSAEQKRARNRRIATGAAIGAAVGVWEQTRRPPEDRHYVLGAATGAAIGGGGMAAVEIIPILFMIGLAIGTGYLGYLFGFHILGWPIAALVVAIAAVPMLFVVYMLSVVVLWALRVAWRVTVKLCMLVCAILYGLIVIGIAICRVGWHGDGRDVDLDSSAVHVPVPRSRTSIIGADWVLMSRETGKWRPIWMDWNYPLAPDPPAFVRLVTLAQAHLRG